MAMPPYFWPILVAMVALGVGIWWAWRRQLDAQRRSMRAFYTLSEQIFAAPSAAEIAEKLTATLPSILQASSVRLYLWNRRTASLESVPTAADPEPMAVSLAGGAEGLAAGAVKCFNDRALLNIPDVRRNALVNAGWKSGVARSAMFAPLLAQTETLGVVEVGSLRRLGYFTAEEQATLAASGQAGGGVAQIGRAADHARAALPQREAGGHRAVDLGRRQRSARAARKNSGVGRFPARRRWQRANRARLKAARRRSPPRVGDRVAPGIVRAAGAHRRAPGGCERAGRAA